MKVDTIKGSSYAMTCTKACTIHAVLNSGEDSMLILEAREKGQYGFVAPTDAVEVSDERALVIQVFKGATPGLFARSGIQPGGNVVQPGENIVLKNLTAEAGTFTGAINANGGVNIPLAVGAPIDTAAVNRLYAAGLATVIDALSPQSFLRSFNSFGDSIQVDQVAPGWCWCLKKNSPGSGTVKVMIYQPFMGSTNYSGWKGFILPLSFIGSSPNGAAKLSFRVGYAENNYLVEKTSESLDVFTQSPASGCTSKFVRFIDVTIYNSVKQQVSEPKIYYPVRVRELMYDKNDSKWIVYETKSMSNAFNNNPSTSVFLAYQQNGVTEAGLWIFSDGLSQNLLRLADLHAVPDTINFNGMREVFWDCDSTGNVSTNIGAIRQTLTPRSAPSNGAYAAFQALETRFIQSTSTYDFTPYE